MIEQKRPVGRPRKIPVSAIVEKDGQQFISLEDAAKLLGIKPEEEPVKNPDCEPATKGYVKCLLRKTRDHSHAFGLAGGDLWATGTMCGWIISMIAFIGARTNTTCSEWLPALVAFSIVCTIGVSEFARMSGEVTAGLKDTPKAIQKWQPPMCERKKDCDE